MGAFLHHCYSSWHRALRLAGVCAVALLISSVSRAADPVEKLREALKIESGLLSNPLSETKRKAMIVAAIPDLKSLSQLRRAYFLKEWSLHVEEGKKGNEQIAKYHAQIGAALTKAVRNAAKDPDADMQLAIAMMIGEIAEIADSEQPNEREMKEKFARGWTDVVLGLAREKDLAVRQAGLHALGKITPNPADAIPLLQQTLQNDELGPRRLAAYALVDLAKNARSTAPFLKRGERLETISKVVSTAAFGLRDADERIRGYCLLAIHESARALADHVGATEEPLTVEADVKDKKPEQLKPELRPVLKAFQTMNPQLLQTLFDPQMNVRLTALQALDQLSNTRIKIAQKLQENEGDKRGDPWKAYDAPDPLASIVEKDWKVVGRLLKEDDVRLRRGAIDFFERLGPQAEPAAAEIAEALNDTDRLVRTSASRAIRNLPPGKIGLGAIRGLKKLLLDPDPDLSVSAAIAIEAIGPDAQDAVDALAFIIGNAGERSWDTDNRVAAMKALASIGGAPAHRVFPQLLSALTDSDERVRRQAADCMGRLGCPDDPELAQRLVSALKNALRDEDAEVRLNASEAILSIAVPRKGL